MCCIFTCCGWMIDLIQRLWTFTMSCCISSAVCCALLTGAISGVALGYNYSLAEYIDLKETNVSVYLKRGIFDDEIGDDMDWRRSGHQPIAGHIGEHNLRTGEPEEESSSIPSGRRLDDSIYESDDRNKFEGSLMKLTAKAPAPTPTIEDETTVDTDKILSKYPMGSLDQMKALQSLINMRKSTDLRRKKGKEETKSSQYPIDKRYQPYEPVNPSDLAPGRKFMGFPPIPGMQSTPGNSARLAVPQESLNVQDNWRLPKLPPEAFTMDDLGNYDERPTYPMPVTQRTGPVRPTRPKTIARTKPTLTTAPTPIRERPEANYPKLLDEDMGTFKDKLLFDAPPSFKDEDFMKNMKDTKPNDDDYGDAIKGIPMRKKRHSIVNETLQIIEINNYFINNSSKDNLKILNKRDNIVSDIVKNVGINKTSTYDSSTDNLKNTDENDNGLLYRLRKAFTNVVVRKELNGELLSSNDKLQIIKNPENAISRMSEPNINLKLPKTI